MSKVERMRFRFNELRKNPLCFWCFKKLNPYPTCHDELATIEHIIPRRFGGGDYERNLRLACFGCNK